MVFWFSKSPVHQCLAVLFIIDKIWHDVGKLFFHTKDKKIFKNKQKKNITNGDEHVCSWLNINKIKPYNHIKVKQHTLQYVYVTLQQNIWNISRLLVYKSGDISQIDLVYSFLNPFLCMYLLCFLFYCNFHHCNFHYHNWHSIWWKQQGMTYIMLQFQKNK